MLWRIYAGYAALILLSIGLVGYLVADRIEDDTRREIQTSLQARALMLRELASPLLAADGGALETEGLQERIRDLGAAIRTRLTVIAVDGRVLADSELDPLRMENHADRPEVTAARSSGEGRVTRISTTLGIEMVYLAYPVIHEGQMCGTVRASLPLSEVGQRLAQLRGLVILTALVASVAALIIGFQVARGVVRPLTAMTEAATAMAEGDYERRIPSSRNDEIGGLARALNHLAASSLERMQTILTERNQLFAILSGMVEGVVAVDGDARVMHMNAVAARILRTPSTDCAGKAIREITRITDVAEVIESTLAGAGDSGRLVRLVEQPRDRVLEVHAAPLIGHAGEPRGAVVVLHDVTEINRLETVRRDFVANVSHELKTPITAIRGLVETMIDDEAMEPATSSRFLARIRDQSGRLSVLVSDLLSLSRLESESTALETRRLDLRDVVAWCSRAMQAAAELEDVSIKVDSPRAPIWMECDEEAMQLAIRNLLDNALKYTGRGGEVWLRVKEGEGTATVEVEDSGIGIEPHHLDRIFERFYRVDKARSRELGGTGLGLAIVKHVAIRHGGDVSVTSAVGRGSKFSIHLPVDGGPQISIESGSQAGS